MHDQQQSRLLRRCRGIDCDVIEALERYNVYTVRDFFSRTCWDLQEILNLSLAKVQDVIISVARATSPSPTNARELLNAKIGPRGFLRTLVDPLDHVLGGGIRSGCITEIVGPAGLGKTQFCLCMCVLGCLDRLDEEGRVLYIDTEKKFSGERLCEIGKSRFPESFAETGSVDEMLRRVIVQVPSSSGNLLEILQDLQGAIIGLNIVLIIIDSIASLARAEYGSHTIPERQKLLGRQASTLKSLAESFNIPILVTNQITTQFQDGKQKLVAALGPMWAHAVNTRLELSSGESGSRSLCLSKSSLAPSIRIPYKVTRKGLEVDSAFPCAVVDQGQGMQGVM